MGLNLSTRQIADVLDLNKDDAQQMTSQLRSGNVEKKPEVILSSDVECDELYLSAGVIRQPAKVRKRGELCFSHGTLSQRALSLGNTTKFFTF